MTATDWEPPTRDDRFSFGLWTVGWQGVDVFGGAIREPLDPAEAVHRLADLGAYGVTFHDDDVFPFGASAGRARQPARAVPQGARGDRPGGADGDHQPVLAPGLPRRRLHQQRPRRTPLRAPQDPRPDRPGRRAGRQGLRGVGRPRGRRVRGRQGRPGALDRYREAFDLLGDYVLDQGYDLRFAIEPKPNEPRGDILLPTVGHALAFINELEHPSWSG